MRCSLEDVQRHCAEELSVRLAAVDGERAGLLSGSEQLAEELRQTTERLKVVEQKALESERAAMHIEGLRPEAFNVHG